MYEVKKVDKNEAVNYIAPVLRILSQLNIPYFMDHEKVFFYLPVFIPADPPKSIFPKIPVIDLCVGDCRCRCHKLPRDLKIIHRCMCPKNYLDL